MSDSKIIKLKYPDTFRNNVGMYLGSVLTFCTPVREIINNSCDELLNYHGNNLIIINDQNKFTIIDDSRGLPIFLDPEHKDRTITRALVTESHVGSKFFNSTERTGGLHGIGSKAVNAVSESFTVIVNCRKKIIRKCPKWIKNSYKNYKYPCYFLKYSKGILVSEKLIEHDEIIVKDGIDIESFGTIVEFTADLSIYSSDYAEISTLPLKMVKYINKQSKIRIINTEQNVDEELSEFNYRNDFVDEELFKDTVLNLNFKYVLSEIETEFDIYIAWSNNNFNYNHYGLVNLIELPNGGFLENCISKAIGNCLNTINPLLSPSDVRYGTSLFYSVFTPEKLSFNSQTKEKLNKLGDLSSKEFIKILTKIFLKQLKENEGFVQIVSERILEYKKQINKLSKEGFVKSKLLYGDSKKRTGISSKLYEAKSSDWSKRILYITEGDSASSDIIKYRNKEFHSILPLKGKILNSSKEDVSNIVNSPEIIATINTIGCGVSPYVNMEKCRYGKVIIAVDQDVDGCLRKGTKIPLLDGTEVKIEDLIDKDEFWVYSCDKNNNIVPGRAHSARITKKVKKLYRITLDNNEIIECTNNHPFLLINGRYVNAENLKTSDCLMSLHRKNYNNSNNYEPDKNLIDCDKIDNHKIINIEIISLKTEEEVYDISVDDYHNFALNSGIFVHNSHIANLISAIFIFHMPELISAGLLYKLDAPFYAVGKGKKLEYYYQNEKFKVDFNKKVQKRKGLGSYSVDEVKRFLVGDETRLVPIIHNDSFASSKYLKLLYSSFERKNLMIDNSILEITNENT